MFHDNLLSSQVHKTTVLKRINDIKCKEKIAIGNFPSLLKSKSRSITKQQLPRDQTQNEHSRSPCTGVLCPALLPPTRRSSTSPWGRASWKSSASASPWRPSASHSPFSSTSGKEKSFLYSIRFCYSWAQESKPPHLTLRKSIVSLPINYYLCFLIDFIIFFRSRYHLNF